MLNTNEAITHITAIAYHLNLMPHHLPSAIVGFAPRADHPIDPVELKRWVGFVGKKRVALSKEEAEENALDLPASDTEDMNSTIDDASDAVADVTTAEAPSKKKAVKKGSVKSKSPLEVVDSSIAALNELLKAYEEDDQFITDEDVLITIYKRAVMGLLKPILFSADYSKSPSQIRDLDIIEDITSGDDAPNGIATPHSTVFKSKAFIVSLVEKYKPHNEAELCSLFYDITIPQNA